MASARTHTTALRRVCVDTGAVTYSHYVDVTPGIEWRPILGAALESAGLPSDDVTLIAMIDAGMLWISDDEIGA